MAGGVRLAGVGAPASEGVGEVKEGEARLEQREPGRCGEARGSGSGEVYLGGPSGPLGGSGLVFSREKYPLSTRLLLPPLREPRLGSVGEKKGSERKNTHNKPRLQHSPFDLILGNTLPCLQRAD